MRVLCPAARGFTCLIPACLLLLTAGCNSQRPRPSAITSNVRPADVIILDDLPLTFRRISPAKYGFPDPGYFLLETEVTNDNFARYLAATGAAKGDAQVIGAIDRKSNGGSTVDPSYSADHRELVWNANRSPVGKGQFPVALVNPKQATAFCEWLTRRHPGLGTFRLPTKTEWLIAAYGRDRKYPWGDRADDTIYNHSPCASEDDRWQIRVKAIMAGDGSSSVPTIPGEYPEPVTARPAGRTPEGLYGMWGNVSELVLPDEWKDGRELRGEGAKWMGGGFDDILNQPRQDYWGYTHNLDVRNESIGFRVLLDPTPGGHGNHPQAPPGDRVRSIYGHPDEWPRPSRWPPTTNQGKP
jgi:formylglycine-generating enzyme required for sulfatase activity